MILQSHNALNHTLENKLIYDAAQNHKFIITGHSLGAAGAVLLAVYLTEELNVDPDKNILITYGQPAVGKNSFNQKLQFKMNHYYRVHNIGNPNKTRALIGDIATKYTNAYNYFHFGKNFITSDDGYLSLDSLLPAGTPKDIKYIFSLHSMQGYTAFIKDYFGIN